MQFSRIISFLAIFLTLGVFTLASPTATTLDIEKRTGGGDGDKTGAIEEILETLNSVTKDVLPQIKSIVEEEKATLDAYEPLLQEIVVAIHNAHVSLLAFGSVSLGNSVNATQIAYVVEEIVAEIVYAIQAVDSSFSGLLSGATYGVDSQLASLLTQLNGLIPTVLSLLGPLLENLAGITSGMLSGFSFFLVAGLIAI